MNSVHLPSIRTVRGTSPRVHTTSGGLRVARASKVAPVAPLVAALLLILTLNVSGTFLIAKQVSVISSGQLAQVADHSEKRISQGSGADEDILPSPKKKRLRGAPAPKVGVDKLFASFIASLAPISFVVLDTDPPPRLLFASDPEPTRDQPLPQELLRRPPPVK